MYHYCSYFFVLYDTATPEIYTLSLHDALPISTSGSSSTISSRGPAGCAGAVSEAGSPAGSSAGSPMGNNTWNRSEEHTSELQSRRDLVCRLLLEKKKKQKNKQQTHTKKIDNIN